MIWDSVDFLFLHPSKNLRVSLLKNGTVLLDTAHGVSDSTARRT